MDNPERQQQPKSLEWLASDDGVAWLESDVGIAWLCSGPGEDWIGSRAGRAWTEGRQDMAWAAYFSAESSLGNPPDWALTPENAPGAGARVRLTRECRTMGGVDFRAGELALVVEAKFVPAGVVVLTVRTLDGRTRLVTMVDELEPA